MSMTMEVRDRFRETLCQALDEGQDENTHQQVVALIAEYPELADEFVTFMQCEACLEEIFTRSHILEQPALSLQNQHEESSQSDGAARKLIDDGRGAISRPSHKATNASAEAPSPSRSHQRIWRITRLQSLAALAATVLIAFGLYSFVPRSYSTLTASHNPVWQSSTQVAIGSEISNGWHELQSGSVTLASRSRAEVLIQGPARFRVDGAKHCELTFGTLTANVPSEAVGFAVKTPDMRIVDLGTGFRVTASPSTGSQVQVLEGYVRIDTDNDSRKLLAGDVAKSGPESQGLLTMLPQGELVPSTSPWIVYRTEHPHSLEYGAFRGNDRAYLYLEGKYLLPSDEVKLNCTQTGVHSSFTKTEGKLPQQTLVDCYLLHSAPFKPSHTVKGTITFAGEILGVIATSQDLNDSNSILGLPWTLQCHHQHRGLESPGNTMADQITISPDRRTLSVSLKTTSIDQLRVLVRSSSTP
jgi:ferric-dicitrate binding protein FerR (iron transport regulator)